MILKTDFDPREPLLAHNSLSIAGQILASAGIDSVKLQIAEQEFTAPDTPDSRFELTIDTSEWPRGVHPFKVIATDETGNTTTISGSVDLEPYEQPPPGDSEVADAIATKKPAMWCDHPDLFGAQEAKLPLEITGWASSPAGIEAVLVTIDGRLRRQATHGLMLPQMATLLGEEGAATCGFALLLDPSDCGPGAHELTVVAVAGDGRALGISGTVQCLGPVEAALAPGEIYEPLPETARHDLGPRRPPPQPEHCARYGWAAQFAAARRVLDAGCGTGAGTAMLAEHAGEAIGIDIAPPAIEDAKRNHGGRARFLEADMRELPFADDEFDTVVCFEALAHVADPDPALDELRRVLAPNGLLLLSSPNRGAYPAGNPLHLNEMTSDELERSLNERFANVVVHRQHAFHASLLCSKATMAHDDPKVTIGAEVKKLFGVEPGNELYAIVAASDGSLPGEPSWVVLGVEMDYEEQRHKLEMWQKRAAAAELEAAEMRQRAFVATHLQRLALESKTPSPSHLDGQ